MNTRNAAGGLLVAAEEAIRAIPETLTLCSVGKIIKALRAVVVAMRAVLEHVDAIE